MTSELFHVLLAGGVLHRVKSQLVCKCYLFSEVQKYLSLQLGIIDRPLLFWSSVRAGSFLHLQGLGKSCASA